MYWVSCTVKDKKKNQRQLSTMDGNAKSLFLQICICIYHTCNREFIECPMVLISLDFLPLRHYFYLSRFFSLSLSLFFSPGAILPSLRFLDCSSFCTPNGWNNSVMITQVEHTFQNEKHRNGIVSTVMCTSDFLPCILLRQHLHCQRTNLKLMENIRCLSYQYNLLSVGKLETI